MAVWDCGRGRVSTAKREEEASAVYVGEWEKLEEGKVMGLYMEAICKILYIL